MSKDEKVFNCPNCGVNVFESGIIEVLYGATTTIDIKFDSGEPENMYPETDHFDDQWVDCKNCSKTIPGLTAVELIGFFEGSGEFGSFTVTVEIIDLKDPVGQPAYENVKALTKDHAIDIVKKRLSEMNLVEVNDYKIETCYINE